MIRTRAERGEGRGGCIFGLIFLLVAIFVAYKMIPIKVKAAELRGTIIDQAKSAGLPRHDDAYIRHAIMYKAKTLQLPLNDKDLKIHRTGSNIRIAAEYVVPVDFPGYTYNWKFRHEYENPIF
jgi:hypothetical protein